MDLHVHTLAEHKKTLSDGEVFVCGECETIQVTGPQYNCTVCLLDLCNACFLKKTGKKPPKAPRSKKDFGEEISITEHSHKHPLKYYPIICYPSAKYICDVCRKHFDVGEQYHCVQCNYDNCKDCFTTLTESYKDSQNNQIPNIEPKSLKTKSLSSPSLTTPQTDAPSMKMPKRNSLLIPDPQPFPISVPQTPIDIIQRLEVHAHQHPLKQLKTICYKSGTFICDQCKKSIKLGDQFHCSICKYDNCRSCFLELTEKAIITSPKFTEPLKK